MSQFSDKIEELYYSTGEFKSDFKSYLKSLSIEDQKVFIEELYASVTLDGVNDKIESETKLAIQNINDYKFRFAEHDYKEAVAGEPTSGERLFNKQEDGLKYRATYYFHERKRHEVYFALNQIELLYKSITNRIPLKPSSDNFIDDVTYKFDWKPLSFPEKAFSKRKLQEFLRIENFRECFYIDSHYDVFKSNSFTYFNEDGKHQFLSIPIIGDQKNAMAEKMQKLFDLTKQFKSDYSRKEYDFRKPRFAEVLMANFKDFRGNTKDETSYKLDLKTTLSRMR